MAAPGTAVVAAATLVVRAMEAAATGKDGQHGDGGGGDNSGEGCGGGGNRKR